MKSFCYIILSLLGVVNIFAQHEEKAVSIIYNNAQNVESMQSDLPTFEYSDNGLRGKTCQNIIEDSDGYLWVLGTDGVSRYDGLSFVNFYQSNSRDQMENAATAICEDTITNCIWISMRRRSTIVSLNKRTYQIKEIPFSVNTTQKGAIYVQTLFNYSDSLLLAQSGLGIFLINKYTGATSELLFDQNSKFNMQDHVLTLNGNDYMVNSGKLCQLVGRNKQMPQIEYLDISINENMRVRHIAPQNDHAILIEAASSNRKYFIYSYDINTGKTEQLMCVDKPGKSITGMNDGFWLWTISGVYYYRYADHKIFLYTTRNTALKDNDFHCSLKLRNQPIIYVGTANGIMKNDYYNSKFKITDIRRVSESANCNPIMTYKDKYGTYWLWLLDGMYRRTQAEYLFKKVDMGNMLVNSVVGCYEDTTRNLLYFNSLRSLIRHKIGTNNFTVISPDSINSRIMTVSVRPDGRLLYATASVAYEYNPQTNKNRTLATLSDKMPDATAMRFDGDSLIWIGSRKSQLLSYNYITNSRSDEVTIGNEEKSINQIRCTHINGIHEVWVAASANGLNYYLPSKHHVTRIEYHPMLFGSVNNLEIDAQNNLWINSPDGLLCINNSDGNVYEYNQSIYNLCPRFNITATSISSDGNMLMGGPNYFIEFNSVNFAHNNYYPKPIINSYKFINSTALAYDNYLEGEYYNVTDTIEVPAGVRSVQIQTRVLNYSNPEYNVIQWRMASSTWTTINVNSPITFPMLTRGINKIELRSCDINGIPVGDVRTLYLNKHVYYYEHPLFYALLVVLGVFLIVAIILIRSYSERQQRIKLKNEVERQAGEIKRVNRQLRTSQTMIEQQNIELRKSRDNLEQQVAERTAELEVAKQKAEESSKLKSAFLANLSHEVRTPMNCIVGFAKLMGDPDCDPNDLREFAHLIQESSNGMLVLIGDLLDVSRIESGQLRVNLNDFEVSKEIYDVYKMLSIERKNPSIDFLLDADSGINKRIIYSDKDRFRQIIINLSYNAFKFTEKGYVCIHARIITPEQLPEYAYPADAPIPTDTFELLLVSVEDTGIGIPADKTQVIFEPFRKLNNNKTLYPGLGLGLNIVKNLIMLLKGQIWLTSIENKGTTFYFYLPF